MATSDEKTPVDIADVGPACVGCHACMNVCPSGCILMMSNAEGFLYPRVECARCSECGLCRLVCPVLSDVNVNNEIVAYACVSRNEAIRAASSSGGVFTVIAEQVIADGGVVFGAAFGGDLAVVHQYVESKNDLERLRGSKYVQSAIGNTLRQAETFLRQGRRVLFSGTPCQIAGLKSFLRRPYANLLCVDFFCHGVPSPRAWQRYLFYQESRFGAPLLSASFRCKEDGWRRYSLSLQFGSGEEYRKVLDKDPYLQAFLSDICLRPTCHACRFKGLHRQSDVSLADFWGVEACLPAMDDDLGTSLVLVGSEGGRLAVQRFKRTVSIEQVPMAAAVRFNRAAVESVRPHPMREAFFTDLEAIPFDRLVQKYCSIGLAQSVRAQLVLAAKRMLGTVGLLSAAKRAFRDRNPE